MGIGTALDLVAGAGAGHGQVLIAEESHVVVLEPVEKGTGFLALLAVDAARGGHVGGGHAEALAHGGEVVDNARHLAEDVLEGLAQRLQFGKLPHAKW